MHEVELAALKLMETAITTQGQPTTESQIPTTNKLDLIGAEKFIDRFFGSLETSRIGRILGPVVGGAVFYGLLLKSSLTSHRNDFPLDEVYFLPEKKLVDLVRRSSVNSGMHILFGTKNPGETPGPLEYKNVRLDDHLLETCDLNEPTWLAITVEKLAILQRAGKVGDCFFGRILDSTTHGSGSEKDHLGRPSEVSIFAVLPPPEKPWEPNAYRNEIRSLMRLSANQLTEKFSSLDL